MSAEYLVSIRKQFEYYKMLGDKTFNQLSEEQLFWQPSPGSNSIAVIIKHLWGNMLSRWTDFLLSDGEKNWRDREAEFDNDISTRAVLLERWEQGWQCLFQALDQLTEVDLSKIIYIRNMGHTVLEAINRQLAHYPYHVGQIVFIGKWIQNDNWQSLSIPKGLSNTYNNQKFAQPKSRKHFTDEYLKK
jgi:hypothetical protein